MTAHKYQALANTIISKIAAGHLRFGEKLPSIRALMLSHDVSKNTVIKALAELEKYDYIEARIRLGYFVKFKHIENNTPVTLNAEIQPVEVTIPQIFYDIMQRSAAFDISPSCNEQYQSKYLLQLQKDISKATKVSPFIKASYYDSPIGLLSLRKQICTRYRNRDFLMDESEVCITSGCQHSLFLSLFSVCKPGDTVAVESPGFYGIIQLLEQLQLNIIEIPVASTTGLDLDALEQAASKWDIAAVVVTPSFSTPTGALMPIKNRQRIVTIANTHDFAVIEDDIYGELGFDSNLPPVKTFDSEQRVILCSSFSKSLSRDLRIGWVNGGRWHEKIIRLKLTSQLASGQLQQLAVAEFMANGHFKRHLHSFKSSLLLHRNQLLSALLQYGPSAIKYSLPQGGLALWVEFSQEINTTKLYSTALKKNIVLTPGQLFSSAGHFSNSMRISFNHPYTGQRLNALKQIINPDNCQGL
ncbi:PLP-dependent aminotransferase family protein [Thalassotalea nanhaiensis]|uniref:PLP-dependent aminotransferase family protein n=1 Tax=Thalassotalea nanhaiensis TaxID=3065648 RepID=A0ABY9TMQ4_9GAMM|nr:PLP-dependent aminotransferase family protein [Colwelliaceae bacterium SQ345]